MEGTPSMVSSLHRVSSPYMGVAQKKVPKMDPRQMETWSKTCGPISNGLILTHTHFTLVSTASSFPGF